MPQAKYYLEDEISVQKLPDGSSQARVSRKFLGPDDVIEDQVAAIREFKEKAESHLFDFEHISQDHRKRIMEDIKHKRFFLKSFSGNQWGSNPEFDRLRRDYIQILHDLERELRNIERDVILKKLGVEEKILDAKKELSPFRGMR